MAKTAKLKKKQAAPHSRAARRAASPSIPVPEIKRTRSTSPKPSEAKHHVLTHSAGVSKRKNTKLTRAQRVRAEKAMERAADDMDKWEKKKAKSLERARGIKERAKLWDDINGETTTKKQSAFAALAEGEEAGNRESVWVDVGDEDGDGDAEAEHGAAQAENTSVAPPVEEDELL